MSEELKYTEYFVTVFAQTNCPWLRVKGDLDSSWGFQVHTHHSCLERFAAKGMSMTDHEFSFDSLFLNGTSHTFTIKRRGNTAVDVTGGGEFRVSYSSRQSDTLDKDAIF